MDKPTLIKALLCDTGFLCKCIVLLYEKQTADEQATSSTHHDNGVGFTTSDAVCLTRWAEHIIENGAISPDAVAGLADRMQKYAKQLSHYLTEEDLLL